MREEKTYHTIGLMSGTSLDGVDLAYCSFTKNGENWSYDIIAAETISYSNEWTDKLIGAISLSAEDLLILDVEYGKYLAELLKNFIASKGISQLDFIASHGHTVHHQPHKGITIQIGNASPIVNLINIPVINDFRKKDVELNGQGAPLVPIGDRLLFPEFDACINLGGFMNISFEYEEKRLAMDVCPFNIVMNELVKKKGMSYDKDGKLASRGRLNKEILDQLNNLNYYHDFGPKSLGREWVEECVNPLLIDDSVENLLHTWSHHSVFQLKRLLEHFKISGKLLLTGGGVYNRFFIESLQYHIQNEIEIPDKMLIDFKEAMIFGFLGVLNIRNEINTLSSVTGASSDSIGGVLHKP